MPRLKSYKRSLAAKRRCAIRQKVIELLQSSDDSASLGMGFGYAVLPWHTSLLTGKPCKLVIPDVSDTQKFALVVGDSHLRHLVDGFVPMPEGALAFGMLSVPGGRASQIKTEVLHAEVPRTPDVVCLLAPSNNVTASRTAEEAGAEFGRLLQAVCDRWPKVCVLDFVPRLTMDAQQQEFFRQELQRVAARLGVSYHPLIDHFPWHRRELWDKFGVHLSNTHGMPILAQLLWDSCYHHVTAEASTSLATPTMSQSRRKAPSVQPKIVVKGRVVRPLQSEPLQWTAGRQLRKRKLSGKGVSSPQEPKKRKVHRQPDGSTITLKECSIPLNPVRFSRDMLDVLKSTDCLHSSKSLKSCGDEDAIHCSA